MMKSPSLPVRTGPTFLLMSTASNMIGTFASGLPWLSTILPRTLVMPSAKAVSVVASARMTGASAAIH